jgi:uncharacterized protein
MISFDSALKLLEKHGCSAEVVKHCRLVSAKAEELAKTISKNAKIDVELCRVGGLIHDIGRSKTNGVDHGVIGAEILKEYPLLARICESHIGGGIDKDEAKGLGLPVKDYAPISIEEKVVCYADKLVQGDKYTEDISEELRKLENKLGKEHSSIKRLKQIESEIKKLIE